MPGSGKTSIGTSIPPIGAPAQKVVFEQGKRRAQQGDRGHRVGGPGTKGPRQRLHTVLVLAPLATGVGGEPALDLVEPATRPRRTRRAPSVGCSYLHQPVDGPRFRTAASAGTGRQQRATSGGWSL